MSAAETGGIEELDVLVNDESSLVRMGIVSNYFNWFQCAIGWPIEYTGDVTAEKWDEYLGKLAIDSSCRVREKVAMLAGEKYWETLIKDSDPVVRGGLLKGYGSHKVADRICEILVHDEDPRVRTAVVEATFVKYYDELKDDPDEHVRNLVHEYQDQEERRKADVAKNLTESGDA